MDDKQIAAFEAALVADGWSKEVGANIREYKRDGLIVISECGQEGKTVRLGFAIRACNSAASD